MARALKSFPPRRTDEQGDSIRAYLFRTADSRSFGVAVDRDGTLLPRASGQIWLFEREFDLGVQHIVPAQIHPEPVIRGIKRQGFYTWPVRRVRPLGTNQ